MTRIVETIGAVWELTRLAAISRFRLRSAYWQWRYETAFGTDPKKRPGLLQRIRAMLEYGRWVYRIKRSR